MAKILAGILAVLFGLGMLVSAFVLYLVGDIPEAKYEGLFWMGLIGFCLAFLGFSVLDDW